MWTTFNLRTLSLWSVFWTTGVTQAANAWASCMAAMNTTKTCHWGSRLSWLPYMNPHRWVLITMLIPLVHILVCIWLLICRNPPKTVFRCSMILARILWSRSQPLLGSDELAGSSQIWWLSIWKLAPLRTSGGIQWVCNADAFRFPT